MTKLHSNALHDTRRQILIATLEHDLNTIIVHLTNDLVLKKANIQLVLKGKEAITKHLTSLFQDYTFAIDLSNEHIDIEDNVASEWGEFTLFIDHKKKDTSFIYQGNYSIIWEKSDSEIWQIKSIIDSSVQDFPLRLAI